MHKEKMTNQPPSETAWDMKINPSWDEDWDRAAETQGMGSSMGRVKREGPKRGDGRGVSVGADGRVPRGSKEAALARHRAAKAKAYRRSHSGGRSTNGQCPNGDEDLQRRMANARSPTVAAWSDAKFVKSMPDLAPPNGTRRVERGRRPWGSEADGDVKSVARDALECLNLSARDGYCPRPAAADGARTEASILNRYATDGRERRGDGGGLADQRRPLGGERTARRAKAASNPRNTTRADEEQRRSSWPILNGQGDNSRPPTIDEIQAFRSALGRREKQGACSRSAGGRRRHAGRERAGERIEADSGAPGTSERGDSYAPVQDGRACDNDAQTITSHASSHASARTERQRGGGDRVADQRHRVGRERTGGRVEAGSDTKSIASGAFECGGSYSPEQGGQNGDFDGQTITSCASSNAPGRSERQRAGGGSVPDQRRRVGRERTGGRVEAGNDTRSTSSRDFKRGGSYSPEQGGQNRDFDDQTITSYASSYASDRSERQRAGGGSVGDQRRCVGRERTGGRAEARNGAGRNAPGSFECGGSSSSPQDGQDDFRPASIAPRSRAPQSSKGDLGGLRASAPVRQDGPDFIRECRGGSSPPPKDGRDGFRPAAIMPRRRAAQPSQGNMRGLRASAPVTQDEFQPASIQPRRKASSGPPVTVANGGGNHRAHSRSAQEPQGTTVYSRAERGFSKSLSSIEEKESSTHAVAAIGDSIKPRRGAHKSQARYADMPTLTNNSSSAAAGYRRSTHPKSVMDLLDTSATSRSSADVFSDLMSDGEGDETDVGRHRKQGIPTGGSAKGGARDDDEKKSWFGKNKGVATSLPSQIGNNDSWLARKRSLLPLLPRAMRKNAERSAKKEELLNQVFPKHVAEALLEGREVEADRVELATMFFSDIVGFTDISSKLTPDGVSDMLDRLYLKFDALSEIHDVFKIETIGDAYVGACNLVKRQESDHAKRIVDFAVGCVKAAAETRILASDPGMGTVRIRVGVHCGPLVARVVGRRNPRYCVFGDTVNVTARMESNSEAMRIHCSKRAAEVLRRQAPGLRLEPRGMIPIKGKGEMETFFVDSSDYVTTLG